MLPKGRQVRVSAKPWRRGAAIRRQRILNEVAAADIDPMKGHVQSTIEGGSRDEDRWYGRNCCRWGAKGRR